MKPIPLAIAAVALAGAIWGRKKIGWEKHLFLFAGIGALAAYGFGAFEVGSLEDIIREIGPTLGAWAYLVVGALSFLETAALIGLAVPGELTVIIGGVAAAQGGVDLVPIFLVAWMCAAAGDIVSFFLGRRLGRPFLERHGPKFGISEGMLVKTEQIFAKHGGKTILVGRFISILRSLAPFVAGVSRMSPWRFIAVDVIGAGLWAATFTTLGYVAASNLDTALDIATKAKLGLGGLIAVIIIVVIVRKSRDARRPDAAPAPDSPGGEQ
jgi:membrane protein DedA with SNARE-associated domain